ncbi:MAG TPA: hypothetical protein VF306_08600 [Pirellulales bacterium]
MSEQNPYQSSGDSTPRKTNWAAIILRLIGSIMLIYWLSLVFGSGIISLKLLGFSLLFLLGPSFPDLARAPTRREVLRDLQQRAGGNAQSSAEPSPSPEDFLRQLEQDEAT